MIPNLNKRIQDAVKLARTGKVLYDGIFNLDVLKGDKPEFGHAFRVQGSTGIYNVCIYPDGSMDCTCPDYEYRAGLGDYDSILLCKHCLAVIMTIKDEIDKPDTEQMILRNCALGQWHIQGGNNE